MKHTKDEMWKPIAGYEGLYEVSNYGRVRSVAHFITKTNGVVYPIKSRFIHVTTFPKGYYGVMLYKDKKHKHAYIHRLVAETFIPNPNNFETVNHKDENKTNNHVSNLEWCSSDYNIHYGSGINRMRETQRKNNLGGKPVLQYTLDGKFVKEYQSVGAAARHLGTRPNYIFKCCHEYSDYSQVKGYQWKFKDSDKKIKNILPIVQMDLDGNEIARFASAGEVSRLLGFPKNSINNCLSGKRHQYHGFLWKRVGKELKVRIKTSTNTL